MVQGTSSHAGKSTVVAGLCRLLSDAGYDVAPFKAQNMSLNSTVTPDGGEIAMSQAVQAEGARTPPRVEMNPVLLKPNGETGSQVVVNGEPVGDMESGEYYDRVDEWLDAVENGYRTLSKNFDVVIAEGAGSPAEINIRDFANMPTAKIMDAPVLLVADIERGGTFASIHGTVDLLGDEADRIKTFLINKFRGEYERLRPGIEQIEELTGKNCCGVLPHDDPGLPAEDSLSVQNTDGRGDVAVIRHPHISNFTDVEPLTRAGIGIRYVTPGEPLNDPDAVVLPGTKRTLDDLRTLKKTGTLDEIQKLAGTVPIIGICGGYQMLGQKIEDHVECVGTEEGAGILPVETEFRRYEKTTQWNQIDVRNQNGLLRNTDTLTGYEIHMGQTRGQNLDGLGATAHNGLTFGTYLHGTFENPALRQTLAREIGVETDETGHDPYDAAADIIRENTDLETIENLLEVEI